MSIRGLALELYRAMKEVERLEKSLRALIPGSAASAELEQQLRKARAEERRIRSLLDGAKEG